MRSSSFVRQPVVISVFLTLIVLVCGLLNSCRKLGLHEKSNHPDQVDRFFQLPPNSTPAIKQIAENMRRQNLQFNFLPAFIDRQGFAVWDKVKIIANKTIHARAQSRIEPEDTTYIIPLVRANTSYVHGFIACKNEGDSTYFNLFDGSTYGARRGDTTATGINDKKLALFLMSLEKDVFGHELYKVTDTSLFKERNKVVTYIRIRDQQSQGQGRMALLATGTICYSVSTQGDGMVHGCDPGVDNYGDCAGIGSDVYCDDIEIWGDDGYIEGGGAGGGENPGNGGGGGGGSSGGDGSWTNPCRTAPGNGGSNGCGSGGPLGWNPVIVIPIEDYNPNEASDITLSRALRDSFPCIASLIQDSLPNANIFTQQILYHAFGSNTHVKLKYALDYSLTKDSLDAYTIPIMFGRDTTITPNSFTFEATIYLNPWVLKHSANEYIVGNLIHEPLHAFIEQVFYQYAANYMDSTEVKALFPIYWDFFASPTQSPPSLPPTTEHQIMASLFVDSMANVIKRFYTGPAPNVQWKDSVSRALAWGGLSMTNVWKAKSTSEKCNIVSINLAARDTSLTSFQPSGNGLSCPVTNTSFQSLKLGPACN